MTSNKSFRLLRPVGVLIANTAVTNWVWKNRKKLVDRVSTARRRKRLDVVDTTRPEGDRYVPAVAGPPPSPFQAALADAGKPVTDKVRDHLEDSAARVRIDDTPNEHVSS